MDSKIKKRLLRIAVLSAVALFVGAGLGLFEVSQDVKRTQSASENRYVPGIEIDPAFVLTDGDGARVSYSNFKGQYKLIYFGFTYCPAICPTELQKISKAMGLLGDQAEIIQPIFITIDPERDTPEVMGQYVDLFHPKLVGLTGTPDEIAAVMKNYRVFANKVLDKANNDYTMDHSSFIYLVDTQDKLIGLYRIEDSATFMADDIRAVI